MKIGMNNSLLKAYDHANFQKYVYDLMCAQCYDVKK